MRDRFAERHVSLAAPYGANGVVSVMTSSVMTDVVAVVEKMVATSARCRQLAYRRFGGPVIRIPKTVIAGEHFALVDWDKGQP